jgi:hypothetical protein
LNEASPPKPINNVSGEIRRMVELPDLHTIALPRAEIAGTSTDRGSEGQKTLGAAGLNLAGSRAARWASLDSEDRKVFNIWAAGVAAFYSLLVISILGAILLGAYTPLGQKALLVSRAIERSSPELPAPETRNIGK